jgi:hypothetical protein
MYLFVSISWRVQSDFWVGPTHIEHLVTEKNVFWIHLFDKNTFCRGPNFVLLPTLLFWCDFNKNFTQFFAAIFCCWISGIFTG